MEGAAQARERKCFPDSRLEAPGHSACNKAHRGVAHTPNDTICLTPALWICVRIS
jgi:hypothetical protein